MKNKEYRSFQVNVAPGSYGGVIGISSFIIFSYESWLYLVLSVAVILSMCYVDKPFLYALFYKRYRKILFSLLALTTLSLPALVQYSNDSPLVESFAIMLILIGSIISGWYVSVIYNQEELDSNGWKNISGSFE